MAWDETSVWIDGNENNPLYQNMLDDALQALREVTGESIVILARLKEELPLLPTSK